MTNKLSIRIGGRDEDIDATAFLTIIAESVHLLKELDAQMGDGRKSLTWVLSSASKNSPAMVEFTGRPRRGAMPPDVAAEFVKSMEALETGSHRPRYFTDGMLERSKRIASPVGTRVSKLLFGDDQQDLIAVSAQLGANADKLHLPERYTEYGELEGQLGQLTAHDENYEFVIYDPLTDRPIKCDFEPEDFDRVRDAMRRKVVVSGLVTYRRKDHAPLSVRVNGWRPLYGDPPSIKEVHSLSLDLTAGRESEDVIRDLRRFDA